MAFPPPLHGLAWLRRREDGTVELAGKPDGSIVTSPDCLPEGRTELHWLESGSAARAFAMGVAAAGRNSVTALQGVDGAEKGVLLTRADGDRPAAASLEEAVELVEAAPAEDDRARVRWRAHEMSANATSPTPGASIRPVRITGRDAEGLHLRVCYPFWRHHPDAGNAGSGGDNYLSVARARGRDVLLLAADSFRRARARTELRDRVAAAVGSEAGWIERGRIAIPLRGDLADELARLLPWFSGMWRLENEAMQLDRTDATLANPENRRIARALEAGATLSRDGVLSMPDGRTKTVSAGRMADMARAGMIADPPSSPRPDGRADGAARDSSTAPAGSTAQEGPPKGP